MGFIVVVGDGDRLFCVVPCKVYPMSAYKTYAMLADGGGGGAGVNDDPDKILQSAHEQVINVNN